MYDTPDKDFSILSLDAGGTNFVFSAIKNAGQVGKPIHKASNAHNKELCLKGIIDGFQEAASLLKNPPDAISFAFPGPADYPKGVIGPLGNLPAFDSPVALGPMLEEKFKLPVFINNDGDLFAYGEALAGSLPGINKDLEVAGNSKGFHNLIGVTLGTGFGAGFTSHKKLLQGDNSLPLEAWLLPNPLDKNTNIEEAVSIRAIQKNYQSRSQTQEILSPKEIYQIARAEKEGNAEAAKTAYRKFGQALGAAFCTFTSLFDGLIVIGGGLSGAYELFMPSTLEYMRGNYQNNTPRLVQNIYDLEDSNENEAFMTGNEERIPVPGSNAEILYSSEARSGICLSRLGTSEAIAKGAYFYALSELQKLSVP